MKKKRTTPVHWIEFAAYRGVELLLSLFSVKTTFALGEFLGRFAYRLPLKYRDIVMRNLKLAYRNEKSLEEIEILAENIYELTGANLLSSMRIPSLSDRKITELFSIKNLHLIEHAAAERKGAVLVVPHMGNWELLAQANDLVLSNLAEPILGGTHYRPLNNPPLNRLIERRRKRRGARLFSKRTSLHTLTAFLREGNLIAILADQRVGKRGKVCQFFNLPTDSSPLPELLAKRSGATVLSLHCRTTGPGKWELALSEVYGQDTQSCMNALEKAWRSSPEDVFWFQDRWRYQIKHGMITAPEA